jgi:hypothetical protein
MKMTLNKDQFRFHMNAIRPDNFSYEGQGELFDYLDEIDSELEFDPIAICCDFSQCSLDEFLDSFYSDINVTHHNTVEEKREAIAKFIGENGFWFAFVEDGKEVVFENF